MKIAKLKKVNEEKKVEISETYSINSLIRILTIILLVFGVFYIITIFVVKDKEVQDDDSIVVFDSTKITLNQLLSRKEKSYYVIATINSLYESSYIDVNYIEIYNNYINKYKQKQDSLEFYYIDLDDALNKKYLGDDLNITDDLSKIRLNDEILFEICDGKIENSYVGKDEILDKLSNL